MMNFDRRSQQRPHSCTWTSEGANARRTDVITVAVYDSRFGNRLAQSSRHSPEAQTTCTCTSMKDHGSDQSGSGQYSKKTTHLNEKTRKWPLAGPLWRGNAQDVPPGAAIDLYGNCGEGALKTTTTPDARHYNPESQKTKPGRISVLGLGLRS